jgi:predicted Zn-dependent protease
MKFKKLIVSGLAALTLIGVATSVPSITANAATDSATTTKIQATTKSEQDSNVVYRLDEPQDVTVYVPSSYSSQTKSAIKYAMDQWNSTELVHLDYYEGDSNYDANIVFTTQNPNSESWGASLNAYLETNDPNTKELVKTAISLDSGLRRGEYSDAAVEHTVMHEMGHALGLDDNYVDPNAIMYYTSDYGTGSNPTIKVNASDYQALKLIYGSND